MKKYILIFFAFFFAFFLEWTFGAFLAISGVRPPFIIFTVLASYWFLSLFEKMSFAFIGGIFIESVLFSAAGTYTALFIFLALATEGTRSAFFSSHSPAMQAASTGILLFLFLNFVQPFNALFFWIRGFEHAFVFSTAFFVFVGSFFWAVVFSLLLIFLFKLFLRQDSRDGVYLRS